MFFLSEAVSRAEKTPLKHVALAFFAVTFSRMVLEYLLESEHRIGPSGSFLQIFLFYAVVFCGAVLVASLFSGQSLRRAAGVAALFYPLVWLAPILDAVFSAGAGYVMSYAYNTTFLEALTSFCGTCTGISPGIRAEVFLILLVLAWYAWLKSSSALRALGAAAAYYVFLVVNAVPQSLFKELFGYQSENVFLFTEIISFYALFITVFCVYFLCKEFPKLRASFVSHFHPLRVLHYSCFALFGVFLAFPKWAHPLPGLVLPLLSMLASVFFAFQAALVANDFFDARMDRKTRAVRSIESVWPLALVFFSLSILNALAVGYAILVLILFALGLAWAYSAPPIRLRRHFAPASAIIAACSLAVFWIGYASGFLAQEGVTTQIPFSYSALVFGFVLLTAPFKDLKDAESDRAGGIKTLPTLWPKAALPLTALLVAAGGLWASYWASLAWWLAAFLSLAAASIIVFVKDPRKREKLVFALEYLFLAFLALWLNGVRFGL